MDTDPVNAALAILTIPLVLYGGYVIARVLLSTWPEFKKIWKETANNSAHEGSCAEYTKDCETPEKGGK